MPPLPAKITATKQQTTSRSVNDLQTQSQRTATALNRITGGPFVVEAGAIQDAETATDPAWAQAVDAFSTAAYVDSGTYKGVIAAALQVNDVIEIAGRYVVEIGSATVLKLRLAIQDGANFLIPPGAWFGGNAASYTNETGIVIPIFARHTVQTAMAAGTCNMKIQGQRATGVGAAILLNTSGFLYRVLRS